ncbi:response regulator [Ruminococcaceae bacterium OttesenSCG-928-D13]|nr:response regulator [Ruminococcaceae bacterium OttesenSCG-928-D13]
MYRVLLVDDEPYVVEWIAGLLELETEPELDVCRAYTAAQAIQWMDRAKVDIVISDIRMPGMDGLELSRFIRANWPLSKLILLTAYAEFDYAYSAMKTQVDGYLLKSEKDERILEEIHRVIAQLDSQHDLRPVLPTLGTTVGSPEVRGELLARLLQGGSGEELMRQLAQEGLPQKDATPEEAPFYLLLGSTGPQDNAAAYLQQKAGLRQILQYCMNPYFECQPVEADYGYLLWLLIPNWNERPTAAWPVLIEGFLETVQQASFQTFGSRLSFVYRAGIVPLAELRRVYWEMRQRLAGQDTGDSGLILWDRAPAGDTVPPETYSCADMAQQVHRCLYDGDRQGLRAALEQVWQVLGQYGNPDEAAALQLYFAVATQVAGFLGQKTLWGRLGEDARPEVLFRPAAQSSWAQAAEYLCRTAASAAQLVVDEEGRPSANIVAHIRQYIDGNLTDDVSLVKLSEVTGYNPSYLSRVYREISGETLNSYISRKKMALIRTLMQDERLSILDISRRLGFESRTYFNRFVKRNTGLSPSKYRESLG